MVTIFITTYNCIGTILRSYFLHKLNKIILGVQSSIN